MTAADRGFRYERKVRLNEAQLQFYGATKRFDWRDSGIRTRSKSTRTSRLFKI